MAWELLAFGGVMFWSLLAVIGLIITTQVHNERVGWAAFTFIAVIAALVLFTNVPTLLANTTPWQYVEAFLLYMAASGLWAIIKWRGFFLPAMFRRYNDLREKFLDRKKLDEMPADPLVIKEFNDQYDVQSLNINSNRMVRNNKGRITTWMIFWPFSLLETFVGDFLANMFDRIYRSIHGLLQRMSDSMASKYSELN